MKIFMLAVGSMGDVRPASLLGGELVKRGHDVTLSAFAKLRHVPEAEGLRFVPFPADGDRFMNIVAAFEGYGANTVTGLINFYKEYLTPVKEMLTKEVGDADAVIFFTNSSVCATIPAEAFGKPYMGATFWPTAVTGEFPPVSFPKWPVKPLSSVYNRCCNRCVEYFSYKTTMSAFKDWAEALGLPRGAAYGRRCLDGDPVQMLGAYSPLLIPVPKDYPESFHVTGCWIREQTETLFKPDDELRAFLEGGDPPVYIGFGSVPGDLAVIWRTVRDAVAETGIRAVINSGWSGISDIDFGGSCHVIGYVPHDWLFSRMSGIIHHGGAGTTAEAIRAGRPSLIVPFVSDQNFWGEYLHKIGCGPLPVKADYLAHGGKAAVRRLSESITELLSNDIKESTSLFAERFSKENGISTAADCTEKYFSAELCGARSAEIAQMIV